MYRFPPQRLNNCIHQPTYTHFDCLYNHTGTECIPFPGHQNIKKLFETLRWKPVFNSPNVTFTNLYCFTNRYCLLTRSVPWFRYLSVYQSVYAIINWHINLEHTFSSRVGIFLKFRTLKGVQPFFMPKIEENWHKYCSWTDAHDLSFYTPSLKFFINTVKRFLRRYSSPQTDLNRAAVVFQETQTGKRCYL